MMTLLSNITIFSLLIDYNIQKGQVSGASRYIHRFRKNMTALPFLCFFENIIIIFNDNVYGIMIGNIYITMYLHFECQYLSTNTWTYFLDEAVIARALPRMKMCGF